LRLSKGLVNQESVAARFDGSDKRRGASRKSAHANGFMALSALLRNFYAPSARDREALLGVQTPVATTAEQPIAHFASSLGEGKTAKK
jgi:hypothetical protein